MGDLNLAGICKLSAAEILGLRDKFDKYISKTKMRRIKIEQLVQYLEKYGFFDAPASGSYHCNYASGLLEHSLNVCDLMFKLREIVRVETTEESCIITSLFHDCAKATDGFGGNHYGINILKSGKVSEAKPYITQGETIIDAGALSCMIISKFVPLSCEEMQAIIYHDGQYVPAGRAIKNKELPLTILLHFADYWSAFVTERGKNIEERFRTWETEKQINR